jgi:hypothetical protein
METIMLVGYTIEKEQIARACHEVNRAYCEALGDTSQVPWDIAPQWQKDSALLGVELHLGNHDAGPQASHESWMTQKFADGWYYGEVKDEEAKTHPCLLPFDELPREQQAKDFIFRAVVLAMAAVELPEQEPKTVRVAVQSTVGMVGVKYIGNRENHVDNLYDTGLEWVPGQVHNVAKATAKLMLKHADVYEECAADPNEVIINEPAKLQDENERTALPHLEGMDKDALVTFAQQHFGERMPKTMKEETMRMRILGMIQERGLK